MDKVVRAFPITSRDNLLAMAAQVEEFSAQQKAAFFGNFSNAVEHWYYQEIAGQPHVICIAEGENLEQGFANYEMLSDEFSLWFKAQVAELTNVDVNKMPKGPESEHVFCFQGQCDSAVA